MTLFSIFDTLNIFRKRNESIKQQYNIFEYQLNFLF